MTSDIITWQLKVYTGLSQDVEQLMYNFVKTGSVRYEGFTNIWQEMNFSLIYCGLKTMEHKREFMEEAFRLAVMYLSPPFDFQQRVGGLYLMYAFYSTQRHRPRLKVRVSVQQWQNLLEMERELKNQGHLDASYILLKLRAQKAFCFVYSSKQFFINNTGTDDNQDKWLAENQRELEQAFPESLLRRLHETHHKYQLLKSQLGLEEERNMRHVQKSMAQVIANRFQDVDGDETSHTDIGDRISKIKAKSFALGTESESDHQTTSASGEDGKTRSPLKRRTRSKPGISRVIPLDDRPLIDQLMPPLQTYQLSDSDDGEIESLPAEKPENTSPPTKTPEIPPPPTKTPESPRPPPKEKPPRKAAKQKKKKPSLIVKLSPLRKSASPKRKREKKKPVKTEEKGGSKMASRPMQGKRNQPSRKKRKTSK